MWWTPAPWTCGPYRCVGVSSRASVSRSAPPSSGLTTRSARYAAMRLGLLAGRRDGGVAGAELVAQPGGPDPAGDGPPAAGQDGAEEQQGEPGADRRSRAAASRENHWHGAGSGCEDVMAGSVRGDRLAW